MAPSSFTWRRGTELLLETARLSCLHTDILKTGVQVRLVTKTFEVRNHRTRIQYTMAEGTAAACPTSRAAFVEAVIRCGATGG